MESHEQQLRNARYRDWVKAGLALKYLKDGIEEFVDDEVKDQQRSIVEEVRKEIGRPDVTCNQCSIDILLPAHKRGSCGQGNRCLCRYDPNHRRMPCPNDVCGRIHDKIARQHMHGRPSWANTDSTKWFTNHWEIAKCFLDGGGYEDKESAADTDCKALLSIITNNMYVQKSVDTPIDIMEPKTDVFSKSKEARNEILHLASLNLPVGKLNNYVDVMIKLLGDRGKLQTCQHSKQATYKLRQLQKTDLVISTEDEWEVRKYALKAVQEKKQEALDEIDDKQKAILEKLQIEQLQETLDKLSKTSTETTQSLSNRQDSLEQRQTLLESTMKQIQELQSDTSRNILDLQQDLLNLKTRINSSDETELLHKKWMDYLKRKTELKTELCKLYSKHLSTIPISPLLKQLDTRVDEFYMDLCICNDQVFERRSNEDTNQAYNNVVTNYRHIFYKENKRVENIFVLGDAGVGKSTWCLKLIDMWLKGILKTQESKSVNQFIKGENMLLEFEVVLFISLRHASKEVDIVEMIRNQIFHQTPDLFEYAEEVLKKEAEKCLVIVDGLDEWNSPESSSSSPLGQNPLLPGRRDLNHCTVLTTSRPWKLNEIRPSYSAVDRAVIIKGILRSGNGDVLARKIISKLNQNEYHQEDSNVKNVEDFVQEVENRFHVKKVFPDLMKIPLIAIFMVLKWFKDGSLESTMAGNYSSLLESILIHEEGYRNVKPRHGQKRKYDGRLSNVPYLEQAKLEWSKEVDVLPECLKKRTICLQYSRLILKLSKIAFEGLFENKVNTLVFSEEVLLSKLTPEEMEVSVKSGILSKTNVIGSSSLEMSKLSFLHKTLQEYLAAIYLVAFNDSDVSSFRTFEKYCATYNRIYELKNVILFACGMDTSVALDLLKHVANIEHSRMCVNENRHLSFQFRLKCFRELKQIKFGVPVPSVPLNVMDFENPQDFEDCLDLLKTNTNWIRHMTIHMDCLSATAQARVMCYLSSEKFAFSNLTALYLRVNRFKCSCTEANALKMFSLRNLRRLDLTSITCKCSNNYINPTFGYAVFDFSECINLEEIKINEVASCEMVFTDNKLKYIKLKDVISCLVRISNKKISLQGEKRILEKIDCVNLEKSTFILSSTNFLINSLEVKKCHMFKVYLVDICQNGQATKMFSKQSSQVASLVCKKNVQCKIEVGRGITSQSVSLLNIDIIPNIPWGKVRCTILNQANDLKNEDVYNNILAKLKNSECLTSLHCMGLTSKVLLKLLRTMKTTKFVQNLEITDCIEPVTNTYGIPKIYGIKHLKFQGLNKQLLVDCSSIMPSLCNIETLELSSVGIQASLTDMEYLPTGYFEERLKEGCKAVSGRNLSDINTIVTVILCTSVLPHAMILSTRSLVNLRCLKCQGFTEENFTWLGECFTELPHLEELGLSCFFWQILENQSLFVCLKNIEKLKTLSLTGLSSNVSSAIADSFLNLRIKELMIDDWDLLERFGFSSANVLMDSLPNLKMLKKLTVERLQEDHFTNLSTTIPKLEEVEYIMLSGAETKYWMPLINLCDLVSLKTFVLKRADLDDYEQSWKTFVQYLPSKGQLQTVQLIDTYIRHEETELKIKSSPVFTSQEWECTVYDRYNITLKINSWK